MMNDELLEKLIEKYASTYGNDLAFGLENDFDAEVVKEKMVDTNDGRIWTQILQVGDVFVKVVERQYRLGYDDYDFDSIDAKIVERKERVETIVYYE
jgi:hypothetical protein